VEEYQTFEKLSLHDKIKTLYVKGTFITSIRYYEYKINLYLFNGIYLEVFYHHKKDQIEKIEQLQRSNTRMKFYLDQVKLCGLPI
jgi:hypothetical protein